MFEHWTGLLKLLVNSRFGGDNWNWLKFHQPWHHDGEYNCYASNPAPSEVEQAICKASKYEPSKDKLYNECQKKKKMNQQNEHIEEHYGPDD